VSPYGGTEIPGLNPVPGIGYTEWVSQLWGIPQLSYQLFTKEETLPRGKRRGTFFNAFSWHRMSSSDSTKHIYKARTSEFWVPFLLPFILFWIVQQHEGLKKGGDFFLF